MGRRRWRSVVATWGSAAWLVLRQFGVPAASVSARRVDIVRVQEADEMLAAAERMPNGAILTIPNARRGDEPLPTGGFSAN